MKKLVSFILAVLVLASVCGCAQTPAPAAPIAPAAEPAAEPVAEPAAEPAATEEPAPITRQFTDSVGRTVELPAQVDKIAISGPLAQIVAFALCPDKLVGVALAWDKTAEQYIADEYYNLPELGQLYGGKGELNLETLLNSGAQVVVDIGEPKKTVVEDLDALQEQTGVPFVHITATLEGMGEAYEKLGELVGMPEEAAALTAYCDKIYSRTTEIANSVEKVNLLYITGEQGLNVIANGSYHAELIDMLGNNLAVVDEPSSKGTGNEVDMEQILKWNPDVVIFEPNSVYASVGEDKTWQQISAIKSGEYYEAPFGPYNWMGFPPSVQRYLGMIWMAKLLYPEAAQYDMFEEAAEYFRLFYHSELSREQYDALVANSIGKQAEQQKAA